MLRTSVWRRRRRSYRALDRSCCSGRCSILLQPSTGIGRFCSGCGCGGVIGPRKHRYIINIVVLLLWVNEWKSEFCERRDRRSLDFLCMQLTDARRSQKRNLRERRKQYCPTNPRDRNSLWVVSFFHDWLTNSSSTLKWESTSMQYVRNLELVRTNPTFSLPN